jgi:hypothetical protein
VAVLVPHLLLLHAGAAADATIVPETVVTVLQQLSQVLMLMMRRWKIRWLQVMCEQAHASLLVEEQQQAHGNFLQLVCG